MPKEQKPAFVSSFYKFSLECLREAEYIDPTPQSMKVRPSTRGITIDRASTVDLDDAIWIEPAEKGGWIAHISISDIASYIAPHSILDKEAKRRGYSVYRPYNPMFPYRLSDNVFSLREHSLRPAVTISLPISPEFAVATPIITQTRLVSERKLSYRSANDILEERTPSLLRHVLQQASIVTKGLRKRSLTPTLVNEDGRQPYAIDEEGQLLMLEEDKFPTSYKIIQTLMIEANKGFTRFCKENNIPIIHRNYIAPAEQSNQKLAELIEKRGDQDIDLLIKELPKGKAWYSVSAFQHDGIGVNEYAFATSPIRRAVDFINWQQVIAAIRGDFLPYRLRDLEEYAQHLNHLESRNKERINEINNIIIFQRIQSYLVNGGKVEDLDSSDARFLRCEMQKGNIPLPLSLERPKAVEEKVAATVPEVKEESPIKEAIKIKKPDRKIRRLQAHNIIKDIIKVNINLSELNQQWIIQQFADDTIEGVDVIDLLLKALDTDDESWQKIRTECVHYFVNNPNHIINFFNNAVDRFNWPLSGVEFENAFGSGWQAIIVWEEENNKVTLTAMRGSKKEAHRAVLLELLSRICDVEIDQHYFINEPLLQQITFTPENKFIGKTRISFEEQRNSAKHTGAVSTEFLHELEERVSTGMVNVYDIYPLLFSNHNNSDTKKVKGLALKWVNQYPENAKTLLAKAVTDEIITGLRVNFEKTNNNQVRCMIVFNCNNKKYSYYKQAGDKRAASDKAHLAALTKVIEINQ